MLWMLLAQASLIPVQQYADSFPTRALIVGHRGKVVHESYAPGFGEESLHRTWSMSKTVTGLLLGMGIKEGWVTLEEEAHATLPEIPKGITVDHLFSMSSGLCWNESYSNPFTSNVIAMLYGPGSKDMGGFAARLGQCHAPATHFQYSSGTSNILSKLLHKKVPGGDLLRYARKKLFEPLGISHIVWERDGAGVPVGSSFFHARARDLFVLGEFMRQGGAGFLPKNWMKKATSRAPGYTSGEEGAAPGHHLWTNTDDTWKGISPKAYAAMGHYGQRIFVLPEDEVVVVRLGLDRDKKLDDGTLLNHVLKGIKP